MISIQLSQQNRKAMNSSTPRPGTWTYHHVLPVRYYFTIAYVCAYAALHLNAASRAARLARECLRAMSNLSQHKSQAERLNGAGLTAETRLAQAAAMAKLCASPLFGGFAGMNPEQRDDDPKEGPELNKPLSADDGWWGALQLLKIHVEAVFPTIGSSGQQNMDILLAEDTLESFIQSMHAYLRVLSGYETCPFDPGDWKICPTSVKTDSGDWIMATSAGAALKWATAAQFDSLNRLTASKHTARFNTLWGGGLKNSLGACFALRTHDAEPVGVAERFSAALASRAQETPHKVYRQLGDRLALYIPD